MPWSKLPHWSEVYRKKEKVPDIMYSIKAHPWWFRQTVADLIRHEGFREFAYPDPLSVLGQRYKSRKYKWGYEPGHLLLAKYGERAVDGHPWTVGYGFTKNINPYSMIGRSVANHRLEVVLLEHLHILDKLVPNWMQLPQVVRTVLANMAFNLGEQRLTKFKPTLTYIALGDYKVAAGRLKKTAWYTQTGARARELVRRLETLNVEPSFAVPQ